MNLNPYRYLGLGNDVYLDQYGPEPPDRVKQAAVAFLVVAGVGLLYGVYGIFAKARDNERRTSCQSNFEQIGLAFMQYVQDNNDHYPLVRGLSAPQFKRARAVAPATIGAAYSYGWADAIQPYLKTTKLYHCPAQSTQGPDDPTAAGYSDYWYNHRLSAFDIKLLDAPSRTLLVGEGNDGTGNNDARASLSTLPAVWRSNPDSPLFRHLGGANYCFVDGHNRWYPWPQLLQQAATEGQPDPFAPNGKSAPKGNP